MFVLLCFCVLFCALLVILSLTRGRHCSGLGEVCALWVLLSLLLCEECRGLEWFKPAATPTLWLAVWRLEHLGATTQLWRSVCYRSVITVVRSCKLRLSVVTSGRLTGEEGNLNECNEMTAVFKLLSCSDMIFSLYCTAELIFVFFMRSIFFFFNTVFLCLCFYAFVFCFVLYW